MQPEIYLEKFFRDYYSKNKIAAPPAIEKREFGIGKHGLKIANRHLSFSNENDLNIYLRNEVPFYISYSAAYYEFPGRRPMNEKNFLKSDLIYEFDSDDIKCSCQSEHDSWKCEKCGATGKGNIERCTKCSSHTSVEQWVCENCLNETKKQVFFLLDFLEDDFAITDGISINFSGHKGYHVHVRNSEIQQLSKNARLELLDYLAASNLDIKSRGYYLDKSTKRMHCPASKNALGWDKRILSGITDLLENENTSEIAAAGGISNALAKSLLNEKNTIISELAKGILHQLPGTKTEKFWHAVAQYIVDKKRIFLDRQTSADITKIIRVPDTIHGSSGLLAKSVGVKDLKEFNPLKEATIKTEKEITVKVSRSSKFYIAGQNFAAFENETVKLPEPAAVYLLARGAANEVVV